MRRTNNGKLFYVVQFVELPFEGIDEYVCVPYSWIISRKATDPKVVVVTYPNNESPLIIRDRVKKKERPRVEEWRFYIANLNYESNTYKDAENWIARRKHDRPCEKEETRDTQPEPVMNRRSTSQPLFSSIKSDKPLLTVKPYKNPRKPLPRISIRRLPSDSTLNGDTNRYKVYRSANTISTVLNPASIVSDYMKRNQSIIINNNQLIQNAPTKTAADSNDKCSSEHTQPDIIKDDEPVMSDQSALPKKQPSSVSQNGEQTLSIPLINVDNDDNHVQPDPLVEERPSYGKTSPNTPERAAQSEPVNERSIPLVHHEHPLPELHRQEVPAGQSNEPDESQRTQLHQLLTAPLTVPKLPGPPSTQSKQTQLVLPANSATYPNPVLEGTNGGSRTKMTYNQQTPRSQGFIDSTLSYDASKPRNLSSSAAENVAVKKLRLENIARKMTSSSSITQQNLLANSVIVQTPRIAQNRLQASRDYARSDTGASGINQCTSLPCMATSAAQNLSNLAHQFRFPVELSHERQCLLTHEKNVRLNNMFRQSNIGHSVGHLQNAIMNGGFTVPSKLNSTSQPSQFLPHYNNQYVPFNRDYMQDEVRHETLREVAEGAHTYLKPNIQNIGVNIQFSAQETPNQLHHHFEHPQQRQKPPKYQDLPNHPFKTNSSKSGLQGVIKTTQSLSLPKTSSQELLNAQRNYFLQDPRIQARLNPNPTEHQIIDLAVPGNIAVIPEPVRQVFEAQTTPLVDQSDDTLSALRTEGIVYQNRRKVMVDQATETDSAMDVEHCVDKIAEESAPGKVESACQTDKDAMEEQGSPYQETDTESADEVAPDEGCVDESYGDMVSEANHLGEHVPSGNNTEKRLTAPENPQVQRRVVAEQEMLDLIGTLFDEMGRNFHQTRDMFSNLRNGIIKCTETYEALLEKVENFNKMEQVQISTPSNNNVMSGPSEQQISGNGNEKNKIGVKGAPKIKHSLRHTFMLPPEYDPTDSKWTLKHREKKRGLVELMPGSKVYVHKKKLKKCKEESKDCRSLARNLLAEVFSRNALSVCSLTGGKAKAFNSFNIDVRPGLDEDARITLLAFVEEYGAKRRWRPSDTTTIISSIRTKILEMRAKFGKEVRGKP